MNSRRLMARAMMLAIPAVSVLLARPAQAYIDLAPTMSSVINSSRKISVVEVVELNRDTRTLTLKEVKSLKGDLGTGTISHVVAAVAGGTIPRPIVQWGTPGSRGILFGSGTTNLVCFGEGWYEVRNSGGAWKMDKDRPDLPLAYYGTLTRLQQAVEALLVNKSAVITVVAYGADNEGASFDLALNKQNLPGLVRVQRIRADITMPAAVMAASANPTYFIGAGMVDPEDLPALTEKLSSPDALVRAEAVEDIRTLGKKAKSANTALHGLFSDASPRVRFAAASAVVALTPDDAKALDLLSKGLESTDIAVRREAAAAAGFGGHGAQSLSEKLGALLSEKDEATKINALLSITLMGRSAAKAAPAVVALLDDAAWRCDAADALGRIGPAARATEAQKKMTPMLASNDATVQWAAVRGMSQIGGADAHPAVDFMIKRFAQATEVEGYNMMIYLAMIGPNATDALQTIQNTRIKNPVLPQATAWAMAPDKSFPWMNGGGMFGPRGGRGGGGGGGGADIFTLILSNYVHELGDRLAPCAKVLAQKIMDNTAGDVPTWGYDILGCGPEESLAILEPHLADADLLMRERATVAIGYMGESGAGAQAALKAALAKAANEREKNLIQWSLRKIEAE